MAILQAYLDNSATTRPSEGVIEAMADCMRKGFYNPSSLYAPAMESEQAMRRCRERIARALMVKPGEIFFTSGGTEANNLAILGSVAAMRGKGHLVVSSVEHPSVLQPFEALKAQGYKVSLIPVDEKGQIVWAELENILRDPPALVSCMQVNNETGAMPDLDRLIQRVRSASPQALIHVDGVQGFLRLPFDARKVDLYTLSSHKIHGPKGVGALYVKSGVRLVPRQMGGGQENAVRSGTENTPGIAGLMRAIEEMEAHTDRVPALYALKGKFWALVQKEAPEAVLNGPGIDQGAPHILNISFPGVRGEVMLHALEGVGVYCSTGSACSSKKRKLSPVLLNMGLNADLAEGALRFSLSIHTTDEEIEYAAGQIGMLYAQLKRFRRR